MRQSVLYSTVICIRKKSFLPILVLVSMLKMAAFSGLLMLAVFSLTISAPVDKRLQALNDTLSAIERLVRYYKSTFRELNIDGLFGLRVLEGKSAAGCSLLTSIAAQLQSAPCYVVFYNYSLTIAYHCLQASSMDKKFNYSYNLLIFFLPFLLNTVK